MILRPLLSTAIVMLSLSWTAPSFADQPPHQIAIGVVNFNQCVESSKLGEQEQGVLTESKKQMSNVLENMKKELEDTANKLQDPDYLDSISSEEVEKMQAKFQEINQNFAKYEAQYMQILNQIKMKFVHTMANNISKASELIAKQQNLSLVVDNDICFYYDKQLDITQKVLEEMNNHFDKEKEEKEKMDAKTEGEKLQ